MCVVYHTGDNQYNQRCQVAYARRLGKKAKRSSGNNNQGIRLLYSMTGLDSRFLITAVPCTVLMDAIKETIAKGWRKA